MINFLIYKTKPFLSNNKNQLNINLCFDSKYRLILSGPKKDKIEGL